MTLENKKLLTVRETVIILVAVVSIVTGYVTQKFTTDAKLARIESRLTAYMDANQKDTKYYETRLQTLELQVQSLQLGFQKMQIEMAELKAKL